MDPRTVDEVIADFKGRRAGIIKALTKDFEQLYEQCDPANPIPLCLYGFPDKLWEVNPLSSNSRELPDPKIGINHVRNSMTKPQWTSMVGLHSQSWLIALTAFFADKFDFDKAEKKRLFSRINNFASVNDFTCYGRSRKRSMTEGRGMPEEMFIHVLSCLRVYDIVRCRSVCKMWRSLIDEPDFASAHLAHNRRDIEDENRLLFIEHHWKKGPHSQWKKEQRFVVRRSDTFRKDNKVTVNGSVFNYPWKVVDSICGVLLMKLTYKNYEPIENFLLWNPSINKVSEICMPRAVTEGKAKIYEVGLGYDASCNDHKVVAILGHLKLDFLFGQNRVRNLASVHVFSVANNCWSRKDGIECPPTWSRGKQVFLNGAIHWTNLGGISLQSNHLSYYGIDTHVVALQVSDKSNEGFKYFKLPEIEDGSGTIRHDNQFLAKVDGSLAMFRGFTSRIEIWVMEEYGMAGSWSRRYNIGLGFVSILYIRNNGELLFIPSDRKGVKSYDVKRNSEKYLAKRTQTNSESSVCPYAESLLLLNGVDQQQQESNSQRRQDASIIEG